MPHAPPNGDRSLPTMTCLHYAFGHDQLMMLRKASIGRIGEFSHVSDEGTGQVRSVPKGTHAQSVALVVLIHHRISPCRWLSDAPALLPGGRAIARAPLTRRGALSSDLARIAFMSNNGLAREQKSLQQRRGRGGH